MKPERAFIAERAIARHCAELMPAAPKPVDPAPALARLGMRLARTIAQNLTTLTGGTPPEVSCSPVRDSDMAMLILDITPFATHSLLASGGNAEPFMASIDAAAILRYVDRAFGGKGVSPSPLPDKLPLSAELMVSRMENMVIESLAKAAGLDGDDAVVPVRRDMNLAELAPFADDAPLSLLVIKVEETGQAPWEIVFTFPKSTLTHILADTQNAKSITAATRKPADPMAEPFAGVPVPVTAIIVDTRVPFSAIANLEVGQILPVAVARSVPLRIGNKTIAHGSIGAMDDSVAVQITQIF